MAINILFNMAPMTARRGSEEMFDDWQLYLVSYEDVLNKLYKVTISPTNVFKYFLSLIKDGLQVAILKF